MVFSFSEIEIIKKQSNKINKNSHRRRCFAVFATQQCGVAVYKKFLKTCENARKENLYLQSDKNLAIGNEINN